MPAGCTRPPGEPRRAARPRADSCAWRMTIATRWADNDAYGHVNNTVYYQWFDSAVNAWLVEAGLLDIDARRSDRPGGRDPLHLFRAARLSRARSRSGSPSSELGTSSVTYRIGMFAPGADEPPPQGEFIHVYVDRASRRPVAIARRVAGEAGNARLGADRALAPRHIRAASRAISSAAGMTLSTAPMPWPDPQMSRQALAPRRRLEVHRVGAGRRADCRGRARRRRSRRADNCR